MMITDPWVHLFGLVPVGCAACGRISIGCVIILFLKVNGVQGMVMGIVWKHA